MVCPLCGYTATLRLEMERHLALHNPVQDKVSRTKRNSKLNFFHNRNDSFKNVLLTFM